MSKREAEELKSIGKVDIVNWYKTYLQQASPKCRRIAIRVWGCNTDLKEVESRKDSCEVIKDVDVEAFKMSCNYYPSLC